MIEVATPPHENQHTVPQAYLRGFANNQQMLWCHDIGTGTVSSLPVKKATALDDFYTLRRADGTYTAGWEHTVFPHIENKAPRAFKNLEVGVTLTKEDRQVIAIWMAVQMLRTQRTRDFASEFFLDRVRVILERPNAPHLDSAGIGRLVAANSHIVANLHITGLAKMFLPIANEIHGRGWTVVRFTDRQLLTSDNPVSAYRLEIGAQDPDDREPILVLPLSSVSALIVGERHRADTSADGNDIAASFINSRIIASADRHVFHDRDDGRNRYLNSLPKRR